jgi:hypothetical protein
MKTAWQRQWSVLAVASICALLAAPVAAQSPADAARATAPTHSGETPKKRGTASTAENRKPAARTTAGGNDQPKPAAGIDAKRSAATPSREFLPASQSGLGCAE